jgi:hypothetical protein
MRSAGFSRPFKGLTVCGDSFVIAERNGTFLAAVVDGLGHGFESWVAAEKAVEVIRGNVDLQVEPILMRCHKELRATRGAAVGILKVEASGAGEFCGVGNIDVQAVTGSPPSVFCVAGIVGHNLRTSRVMPFQMKPGDIYCLLSDGVSSRGNFKSCLPGPPEEVARRIVEQFGRDHDDATALVMGYEADSLLGRNGDGH